MKFISDPVTRRARKDHACDLCGGEISKGDLYDAWSGTWGPGEWWSAKAHQCCHAISLDRHRGVSRYPTPFSVPGGPLPNPFNGRTYYESSISDILDSGGGWPCQEPLRMMLREEPELLDGAIGRLPDNLRGEAKRIFGEDDPPGLDI